MLRKHKYGAKKTKVLGITFSSMAEARRYAQLKLNEQLGKINYLELQPRFTLQDEYIRNGKKVRKIEYVADFKYIDGTSTIVEDVKGMPTETYKLKLKILLFRYPTIIFREVKNNKVTEK